MTFFCPIALSAIRRALFRKDVGGGDRRSILTTIRAVVILLAALLTLASVAYAHVGSPDVYAEGQAGPYKLSVVVRPPLVIPGVADIEVRAQASGIA